MGNTKYAATRMTVSIGVAVLVVMAPVPPASTAQASASDDRRETDRPGHGQERRPDA